MATDDERRRVAERLRGISRDVRFWGGVDPLHYIKKGVFGDVDRHGPNETLDRLIDLIDPGTTKASNSHPNLGTQEVDASQVPECDASQGRRDNVACDREALLALAEGLDARASDLLKTNSIDHSRRRVSARKEHAMDLMTACGRIREACGEVTP